MAISQYRARFTLSTLADPIKITARTISSPPPHPNHPRASGFACARCLRLCRARGCLSASLRVRLCPSLRVRLGRCAVCADRFGLLLDGALDWRASLARARKVRSDALEQCPEPFVVVHRQACDVDAAGAAELVECLCELCGVAIWEAMDDQGLGLGRGGGKRGWPVEKKN